MPSHAGFGGDADGVPVVPGVVHGLRAWALHRDGRRWRLGAVAMRSLWPPGEPSEAICGRRYFLAAEDPDHVAPVAECACGIYAWHPFGAGLETALAELKAPSVGPRRALRVVGVIRAWGRIEVHEAGFRAQYAAPAALLAPFHAPIPGRPQALRAVARLHDVPVLDPRRPRWLRAALAHRFPGLSESVVEELLRDQVEVVLQRSATGRLDERRRAGLLREPSWIGFEEQPPIGSGYVVRDQGYRPRIDDREWPIRAHGVRVVRVAGTWDAGAALQDEAFAPSRRVRLVRESPDLLAPRAVAIFDEREEIRAGYLPRTLAPEIVADLEAGRLGRPMVVWEWRGSPLDRRVGLCVLIPPRRVAIGIDG